MKIASNPYKKVDAINGLNFLLSKVKEWCLWVILASFPIT